MNKSKKEMKGMLCIVLGLLFSIMGMMILSIWKDFAIVSVITSFIGVLIILYGLFRIFKANRLNSKN